MSDKIDDVMKVMQNIVVKNSMKIRGPKNSDVDKYFIEVYKIATIYTSVALIEEKFKETKEFSKEDQDKTVNNIVELGIAVREAYKHLITIITGEEDV